MEFHRRLPGSPIARIRKQRPTRLAKLPFVLVLLALRVGSCTASVGDRDPLFKGCVRRCVMDGSGCVALPGSEAAPVCNAMCVNQTANPAPKSLRLLGWSCRDDCRYRCMLLREALRQKQHTVAPSSGPPAEKYFGKWAFRRVAGMQEIASVLFSLANLLAQAHCLAQFLALLSRLLPPLHARTTAEQREDSSLQQQDKSLHQEDDSLQQQDKSLNQPLLPASQSVPSAERGSAICAHPLRCAPKSGGSSVASVTVGDRDSGGAGRPGVLLGPQPLPLAARGNLRVERAGKRMQVATAAYPWWPLWVAYYGISLLAWAASAVFHARDVPLTEKADYMLADAFILWGCLTAALRVSGQEQRSRWVPLLGAASAAYTWHWHCMLTQLFDYGFNVLLCIVLGALQSLMWGVWVGRVRHVARRRMWCFLALINAATLLEVLDFAPWWGLVDAHALWHAATALLSYVFWGFLRQDVLSYSNRNKALAASSL